MTYNKHLTQAQMRECYLHLLEEKLAIEHRYEPSSESVKTPSQRDITQELSMYDNHPADTATDLAERTKDFALAQHDLTQLDQIHEALNRIQAGTYGTCVTCDQAIDPERLLAIPSTLYCREHVPDKPVLDRRPIEEDVLQSVYQASADHLRKNPVAFDQEEAWRIVEQWGNSDSPAMMENSRLERGYDAYSDAEEQQGYVEPIESFLATDLNGQEVKVMDNEAYRSYKERNSNENR